MIDWEFIGTLEGEQLKGYVPDPEHSHSGVTVGHGIDLGQMSAAALVQFSPPLRAKLAPYLGLRSKEAQAFLIDHPLTLLYHEAMEIESVVDENIVKPLRLMYEAVSGTNFDLLPDPVQTVMASVTFQYGTPWLRCPMFWSDCLREDWGGLIHTLRNFGDRYSTRRNKEADYLEQRFV